MDFSKVAEKYFDPNDDSGFNEILFARQEKIKALRVRLKKQYLLNDDELDKLMSIIEKAELEMEKVKRSCKTKNYTNEDMAKFQDKLVDIQKKMQSDFEEKLLKTIKEKYEKAKKTLEEMNKNNPYA